MNEWGYKSIPHIGFHIMDRDISTFSLAFFLKEIRTKVLDHNARSKQVMGGSNTACMTDI
jgi:hypothetical protein